MRFPKLVRFHVSLSRLSILRILVKKGTKTTISLMRIDIDTSICHAMPELEKWQIEVVLGWHRISPGLWMKPGLFSKFSQFSYRVRLPIRRS